VQWINILEGRDEWKTYEHRIKLSTADNSHPLVPRQQQKIIVVVKALCYKPEGRGFETR
jgi:hypothetical protein